MHNLATGYWFICFCLSALSACLCDGLVVKLLN